MSKHVVRCGCTALLLVASVVWPRSIAEAQDGKPLVARLSAATVNVNTGASGAVKGDTVTIDVIRWSTDAEREQALTAFAKDPGQFGAVLQKQPTLGYIWTGGSVGFAIRYAYRTSLPGGGDRIVLVTDRHLNSGGPGDWTPAAPAQPGAQTYPFTVVELHMARSASEGKISLTATVGVDTDAKTLALENYSGEPVMLRGVKQVAISER